MYCACVNVAQICFSMNVYFRRYFVQGGGVMIFWPWPRGGSLFHAHRRGGSHFFKLLTSNFHPPLVIYDQSLRRTKTAQKNKTAPLKRGWLRVTILALNLRPK